MSTPGPRRVMRTLTATAQRLVTLVLVLAALATPLTGAPFPGTRVLFETGFEAFEGYDNRFDLAGQNSWVAFGSGGNGLLAGPNEGFAGQAAYVGFGAPTNSEEFLSILRPVNFAPATQPLPVIQFTVTLAILDSSTNAPYYDDFRWSVYNTDSKRLFSLEFANQERHINYVLDETNAAFVDTGFAFHNGEAYDLRLTLNFARNVWTAEINQTVIVPAAPITTVGSRLSLGDVDAVWAIRDPQKPGDNFMLFDDYRITAIPLTSIPPALELTGVLSPSGRAQLRLTGEPAVTYAVDATQDFVTWVEVHRATAPGPDGIYLLEDAQAPGQRTRFYRARSVAN